MVKEEITKILKETLTPSFLTVEDESHLHAGHAGVRQTGGGHFRLVIVSPLFEGKNHLERHQAVYRALQKISQEIHALALKTYTPSEWEQRKA